MANNELTVITAEGATKTLRSRDVGSSVQQQVVDVAPAVPTVVASAQYNLSVSTAVVTLTVPTGATHALLTVSDADVKFTEDSSSPSSSNGLLLQDGFIGELALPYPLKFIRAGTVDAKLNVSYRKYV